MLRKPGWILPSHGISLLRPDERGLTLVVEDIAKFEPVYLLIGQDVLEAIEGGPIWHVGARHRPARIRRHIRASRMGSEAVVKPGRASIHLGCYRLNLSEFGIFVEESTHIRAKVTFYFIVRLRLLCGQSVLGQRRAP